MLSAGLTVAYSNPGTCSGACNVHDPSLVKSSDDTYYRFSTGAGMTIATSSSLAGPWTSAGSVLTDGSSISITGNTGSDAWVLAHSYS